MGDMDQGTIKKLAKLMEGAKASKIEDFVTGVMRKSFDPVSGSAKAIYDEWSNRLAQVYSLLLHHLGGHLPSFPRMLNQKILRKMMKRNQFLIRLIHFLKQNIYQ